jgi:hypothetical protein
MSGAPGESRMEHPFCPQCGLPMRLSHLDPTPEPQDRFIWRCVCGEILEKVSLREAPHPY